MPQMTQQYLDAARAYRKQLNAQGIHFGEADKLTERKFPGSIQIINPHKSGGLSKVVGAVGDVVGKAAPLAALIPGVGPLAAAGLTGLGKVAGKMNDPGGIGGMKVFKEGIMPAATTYALGSIAGGASAPAPAANIAPGLPAGLGGVAGMGMRGAQAAGGTMSTIGRIAGGIADKGKSVLGWAEKNPMLAANVAGTALEAYGAHQAGKREDQALERQWGQEDDLQAARARAWENIRARRAASGM